MVLQSVHLLLLMVHLEDGCQGAFLIQEQTLVVRLVLCKQVHQNADVFVQVVEHHPDSLTHHPSFLLCFLDKLKICLTCTLVVRAWLVKLKHLAHLHNIVGNLAAAVMYYINVNRIAHLGIGTGGINLQHPIVLAIFESVKEAAFGSSGSVVGGSSSFFFASSSSRLRFSSTRRFCFLRSLIVILLSSSSEIRLRIVTNRLGSNTGSSENSCIPQKYCM